MKSQVFRTTPYHPWGNPVERFNRTFLGMLGTLENKQKSHWKGFVKPLVHAYNCTHNEVIGFTPYKLMFGRKLEKKLAAIPFAVCPQPQILVGRKLPIDFLQRSESSIEKQDYILKKRDYLRP